MFGKERRSWIMVSHVLRRGGPRRPVKDGAPSLVEIQGCANRQGLSALADQSREVLPASKHSRVERTVQKREPINVASRWRIGAAAKTILTAKEVYGQA